jgi:hypothetical protein
VGIVDCDWFISDCGLADMKKLWVGKLNIAFGLRAKTKNVIKKIHMVVVLFSCIYKV